MDKGQKSMKISTRLFIVNGLFLILTCAVIVALVNYSMKQEALVEAESKIKIMADQYFAIHTYFSQKLKPAIFELTDPIRSKEYFDPVWMSSTYAVREINKYIRLQRGGKYYLRDAAINARSPENEATSFEKEFLSALNVNPKLKIRSGIQVFDDKPFFVVLRRGELMEASCLRCHGSPDKAPSDMVRYYGPERSFYRKVGDSHHVISIRTPLSLAYADANRFSFKLSVLLLTLLFVLFGVVYWFNNRFMFKPLSMVHDMALKISSSEEHLGEEIPLPSGKELNELAYAFNLMSKNLRYHIDNLEELISERTASLKISNENHKQEINQHIQTQKALEDSEEKFSKLFLNSPVVITLTSIEDGLYLDVNESFVKTFGWGRKEVIGRTSIEIKLWPDNKGRQEVMQLLSEKGSIRDHELTFLTKHGKSLNFLVSLYIMEVGGKKCLISAAVDITDRKLAEAEIIHERERAVKYLAISEAIIVGLDPNGIVTLLNRRGYDILGYKENEIVGKNWFDTVIPIEQRDAIIEIYNKVISDGIEPAEYFENEVITRTGERKFIFWHKTFVKNDDGTIIGSLSSGQDFTEQKRAEGQIKASLKEKEVLLQEIHHRAKNNMQVIISLLRLQISSSKDKKVEGALKESQGRVQAMSLVHETLYDSASMVSIDFRLYLFKLAETVFQSYGISSEQVELKNEAQNISFRIDQLSHIGLLINELVTNSLKYAFPESRKGEIVIRLLPVDNGEVELMVSDNGLGIPENIDWRNTDTLGLQLVIALAEGQLEGTLNLDRVNGTHFTTRFKLKKSR